MFHELLTCLAELTKQFKCLTSASTISISRHMALLTPKSRPSLGLSPKWGWEICNHI